MQDNPLNIVDIEWPNNEIVINIALLQNIPNCIEAFKNTYGKLTFGDVFLVSIFCVIDHLIEYKENTAPLYILPKSIVQSMQENAILILGASYWEFNEFWRGAFRDLLNEKIYHPNVISDTITFMNSLNLTP